MSNFNLSIELTKLFGANRVTTKSGQEVIVIPLDSNPITIGKNGCAYLALEAREKKQVDQWGGTHYIKPRYKKEDFVNNLTEEQRQNIPFVGTIYAQPTYNNNNNGGGYNNPNTYTPTVSANDIDDSIF